MSGAGYWSFYRRSKLALAAGVLLAALSGALLVPIPLLVSAAIDRAIPQRDATGLLWVGAALIGITLASTLAMIWSRALLLRVTRRATGDLRLALADHCSDLSRDFHKGREQGRLHDLIVNETFRIDTMATTITADVIPGIVLAGGLAVALAVLNWQLMLVVVATAPVMLLAHRMFRRTLERRIDAYHGAHEAFSKGIWRLLRAHDLTRTQSAQAMEHAYQDGRIRSLERDGAKFLFLSGTHELVQLALVAVMGVIVLVAGGWLVQDGAITVGALVAFYAGFALLRRPLGQLTGAVPLVAEGRASLRAVGELLAEADVDPYRGTERVDTVNRIVVRRAAWSYGEREVLRDVSLTLERGSVVALVGPNGCGKSTTVNLLLGFARPRRGTVLADGIPYDDLDVPWLRRSFGVVPQEPFFFPGTIRENLVYGPRPVTNTELDDAIRLAGVDRFLDDEGLERRIGDDGARLSGGQRQRLAIARALVRKPSVLVFDEPTLHLDQESVERLIETIRSLDPAPAVLVVSHQPEFVAEFGSVIEMRDGCTTFQPPAPPMVRWRASEA